MKNTITKCFWSGALVVCLPFFTALGVNWTPTQGGTFRFEDAVNWNSSVGSWKSQYDMRVTPTGEQYIQVTSPHLSLQSFYPGGKGTYPQIFQGEALGVTVNLRFMGGNVILENHLINNGGDNYIGFLGDVTLTLRNGGMLLIPNKNPVYVGCKHTSATQAGAIGTLKVENGGLVLATNAVINIGAKAVNYNDTVGAPGALWMNGGDISTPGSGRVIVASSNNGYMRINSGTLEIGPEGFLLVNDKNIYGQLHVDGGSFIATNWTSLIVGCGGIGGSAADMYVTSGMDIPYLNLKVGYSSDANTESLSSVTVDKGGTLAVNTLSFGHGNSKESTKAYVNLINGGTLRVSGGGAIYGSPTKGFNFDGGILQMASSFSCLGTVYGNGLTLDLPSLTQTVSANLHKAKGYGVKAITLTNPGAKYHTAPRVTVVGGSGSNATALAVLNEDRTLKQVVVTCCGEGYKADDVLEVKFSSITGSGAEAVVELGENTEGIIRKTSPYFVTATMGTFIWDGAVAI